MRFSAGRSGNKRCGKDKSRGGTLRPPVIDRGVQKIIYINEGDGFGNFINGNNDCSNDRLGDYDVNHRSNEACFEFKSQCNNLNIQVVSRPNNSGDFASKNLGVSNQGGSRWKGVERVVGNAGEPLVCGSDQARSACWKSDDSGSSRNLGKRQYSSEEEAKGNSAMGSNAKRIKGDNGSEGLNCDDNHRGRGGRRFHFKSFWAYKVDCRELVKRCWSVSDGVGAMGRIKSTVTRCTKQLECWNVRNRVSLRAGITEQQNKLCKATASIDLVWYLWNLKVHGGDQLGAKRCDSQTLATMYVWLVDFLVSFRDANGVDVNSRISVGLGVEKWRQPTSRLL
ncbi:hypothetical protein QYF36_015909 [Acer negundo]|nr:hypothetical protein QYF36_015909 [Acer negundo]